MSTAQPSPRRFAKIIRLKPEHSHEYKRIHAAVWPGVLRAIKAANIADYSIFYDDGSSTLFSSFKYVGEDFEGDMRRMGEDEEVRRWWRVTDEMQVCYLAKMRGLGWVDPWLGDGESSDGCLRLKLILLDRKVWSREQSRVKREGGGRGWRRCFTCSELEIRKTKETHFHPFVL